MTRYLRQPEVIGQAEVTAEQAAKNKLTGKGPRRPRPAKPGRYSLSSATLWRMVSRGEFPRPVRLSAGVTAWSEADLDAWDAARRAEGPAAPSANLKAAWKKRAEVARTVAA